ncbi:MAG TPA: methyltransferase domain-containing protein [Atribacterota bacterium]|nr:methyltransferase domain-containing protein [Atribacterota bacterium]
MTELSPTDKPPQRKKKSKERKSFLGPVADLEQHVRPDWWSKIFNYLYLKTDGDVVDDSSITSSEIDSFLTILKPSSDDRILDLCCGQGRHSMELSRRNFQNIEGLDRSHYLIQKAKSIAKKEDLKVKFKEGDARKIPFSNDSFNIIMVLGNSFGYFDTIQDDLRVLKEVFRTLKPWGKLLIQVTDGEYLKEHFLPRSWEWIDKKHFVCRERSLSLDKQRLISREVVTHIEKGIIADQFYAERLYSQENLSELLTAAGFSEMTFHGIMSPDSKRNQDLGMMERCLTVTAVAKKEWTPVRKKERRQLKKVVVLLGDPSKTDPLKPSAIFDDDDLYTIDQLKEELGELKNYLFSYLNNHDNLINDLIKLKEKDKIDIVFNLCDEGYDNEARKELHVPSLLEMINLPYTGSGPQCLAFCYDKSLVRGIAREMGIPVPEAFFIKPNDVIFELSFNFPVIIKPNLGDSSFGITQRSVANNFEEIVNAISEIREKFGYDKPILVEEFLTGKDLSVGILGNPPESYNVLPIIMADYSDLPEDLPKICGYESKWLPDTPYWSIKSVPADLPENTEKFIIECCLKLSERLECRDYCRFDWRLDSKGIPKLLEVNPNPGWCWDGHLAKMAEFAGISYGEMLKLILEASEQRLSQSKTT